MNDPYPFDPVDAWVEGLTLSDVDPEAVVDDRPATWAPVDIAALASGDYQPPTPTLMPRSDGLCAPRARPGCT